MINKVKNLFKNLEPKNIKIIKIGLKVNFLILLLSTLILSIYTSTPSSILTYQIGILLFQTSLYLSIEFIICGIVIDSIKKF